jgi:hypothetical protein
MATVLLPGRGDLFPLSEVYRHDTSFNQVPHTRRGPASCFDAGDSMTALRIAVIIYIAQAAIGILVGLSYPLWRLYW